MSRQDGEPAGRLGLAGKEGGVEPVGGFVGVVEGGFVDDHDGVGQVVEERAELVLLVLECVVGRFEALDDFAPLVVV